MATTPNLLEEIAFHEAGHAVVGFVLGLKFQAEKAITIISDSNFQGRVYFEELPEITSAQQTVIDQCIEEAPAHLCVSFAGPLAQLHTTQADGIDDRVLDGTRTDVRSAAAALFWMNQPEKMGQILVEGSTKPHGTSFIEFHRQFCEAMNQVRMANPAKEDAFIFKVLHSAARGALGILKTNYDLLYALRSRLLVVKWMTGVELTEFLEDAQRSAQDRTEDAGENFLD